MGVAARSVGRRISPKRAARANGLAEIPSPVPTPLPRELTHISGLKRGDLVHLQLANGCGERTISGIIPGHGYTLSDGASVRAGTAVFYHLPDRCPARRPAEAAHHEAARDFKIPSSSHPGISYTVHVSETGMLICNCGAGSYGRPCKHKRQVSELLEHEKHAA